MPGLPSTVSFGCSHGCRCGSYSDRLPSAGAPTAPRDAQQSPTHLALQLHDTEVIAGKLSAFKFYQYLVGNVPDVDVIRFLKMLTFLPLERITALEQAGPATAVLASCCCLHTAQLWQKLALTRSGAPEASPLRKLSDTARPCPETDQDAAG